MPYKDPEKKKEYDCRWRKANPDYQSKYREANTDKKRKLSQKWAAENPEKMKDSKREWREANPDKVKSNTYAWRKVNQARTNMISANRRAKKLQAIPKWANKDLIRKIYKQAKALGLVVDHIIPLNSPVVCGLHWGRQSTITY